MLARGYRLAVRGLFGLYGAFTAWYCLLAYLPFTYHQVHRGGLLPGLDAWARVHPWILALLVAGLLPALPRSRRLTIGFAIFQVAQVAGMLWRPVLPALRNDFSSFLWSLCPVISLLWVAAIDLSAAGVPSWSSKAASGTRRLFWAGVWCGLYCGVISLGSAALRLSAMPGWRAVVATLASQFATLAAAFLILNWIAAAADCSARPALVEFGLVHVAGMAVIAACIVVIVGPPIGLQGAAAWAFAIVFGLAVAAFHAGTAIQADDDPSSGLDAAVAPLRTLTPWGWLVLLSVAAPMASMRLAAMDWNYLLQKLAAVAVWTISLGVFLALAKRTAQRRWSGACLAGTIVILGGYRLLSAGILADRSLDTYAGYDVGYQLARSVLAPPKAVNSDFYQFLARNTNIPQSVPVKAPEQNLVESFTGAEAAKPDIYIFTFDSLRRDYLSPYNPDVTFTPEIARFAAESTVFRNTFTHYGGTGLSEPSIWAGSLLLHKQYVTPFAPTNVLEKLVKGDSYETMITRDPILATLSPEHLAGDLDTQRTGMNYDFCATLDELTGRLDAQSGQRPLFAYTQPQDLHISVIQRAGAKSLNDRNYGTFYAPYASRLERMDGCFGKFVRKLKETGRYERSIIILTADHGDSLGEEGRWGHAYTIFPEVIRIPLLIHVPEGLRTGLTSDPEALTFSTDIAPSLYYLLGHRSLLHPDLAGRPLFTAADASSKVRLEMEQVAVSSYATVYGLLTESGRRLYIADAVNYREYLFEIEDKGAKLKPLTEDIRSRSRAGIRSWIDRINRVYGMGGGGARP